MSAKKQKAAHIDGSSRTNCLRPLATGSGGAGPRLHHGQAGGAAGEGEEGAAGASEEPGEEGTVRRSANPSEMSLVWIANGSIEDGGGGGGKIK